MTSALKTLLLVTAALIFSQTQARAADSFTAGQKTEIEGLIKSYLMEHPDVIVQSMNLYQQKQTEEQTKKASEKLKEHMDKLTGKDLPSAGNPDGKYVVIEFFDYNCGYCKQALPDIQKLVKENEDVRVVFKEMPILGPSSLTASQWAMAAHKQGKYFEYHAELMQHRGPKDEDALVKMAEKVGLDVEKMKKDAASQEINDSINQSLALASEIGIQGTPAFVVNGELYPGFLGENGLKNKIEELRRKDDN